MSARELPLGSSNFRVLIDGVEVGFSEITGLGSESVFEEGMKDVRHRYPPVTLRRAITRSPELFEWRKEFARGGRALRTVVIEQLDTTGRNVMNV